MYQLHIIRRADCRVDAPGEMRSKMAPEGLNVGSSLISVSEPFRNRLQTMRKAGPRVQEDGEDQNGQRLFHHSGRQFVAMKHVVSIRTALNLKVPPPCAGS